MKFYQNIHHTTAQILNDVGIQATGKDNAFYVLVTEKSFTIGYDHEHLIIEPYGFHLLEPKL